MKVFLKDKKRKGNNTVVKDPKPYPKMKAKPGCVYKKILQNEKIPYHNYKKLFTF